MGFKLVKMWWPLLLAVLAVFVLAFFSRSAEPKPGDRPAGPDSRPQLIAPLLVPGPPILPTSIDVIEPGSPPDAGAIEVTLEVFDDRGHAAGQIVELQNPPCPADGGEGHGITVRAMTNVMGFARIALSPGAWEVENFHSAPGKIEVVEGHAGFVLRKFELDAGVIEGIVLDDQSQPVAVAQVATAEDDQPRWRKAYARERNRHLPPVGDEVVHTDEQGRFLFRTFEPSLTLIATKDVRISREVIASPGPPHRAELRLFTPAWARFTSSCRSVFVRYEYAQGQSADLVVPNGTEAMIASGTRAYRARCILAGKLMSATTEVTIKPGEHADVVLDLKRMNGVEVRLVDPVRAVLPGVTVALVQILPRVVATKDGRLPSIAVGVTDLTGTAALVPRELAAYDPLFRIEVSGAWRTQREVLANIGDEPVEVVAVSGR